MLNRLLQPWLVITEFVGGVLLLALGFGITAWGDKPGSLKVGMLSIWMGVVVLVLSFLLLAALLIRRRRGVHNS